MSVSADSSTSSVSGIICDGCDTYFQPQSRFFHCSCRPQGFDLCLACARSKPEMAAKHKRMKTCVLDARDKRPTYIPGPSIDEFHSIMTKLEEGLPSFKIPRSYYHFFHKIGIERLSKQDLASEDYYETLNAESASVTTKAVENDYTVYTPLNAAKKEIRLAHLASGSPNDPLLINVLTVPYPWADHHKEWEALSYTWGSLDETRQIWLNHSHGGKDDLPGEKKEEYNAYMPFFCTANLEIALRRIRRKEAETLIWIDALCINQGDLEERARQVAMMADIYGNAPQVVVWLGSDPGTAQAAEYVSLLPHLFRDIRKKEDQSKARKKDFHILQHLAHNFNVVGNPLAYSELAPRVDKLLANPWFSRAWVVQEVWAARSIVVACGEGKFISWEAVILAHSYAAARATANMCGERAATPVKDAQEGKYQTRSTGHSIWGRLVRNPGGMQLSEPIPILELLSMVTLALKAGDKRDLVFAILGMSVEASGAMHQSPLVTPDYTKHVWQVYSDFTRWYIHHCKSLNILGYVTYTQRGEDVKLDGSLPSWSISPSLIIPWSAGGTISDRTPFHADGDTLLDTTLIESVPGDCSLATQGYVIDSIAWVDNCFFSPLFKVQNHEGPVDIASFPWRISLDHRINPNTCGLEWLWRTVRAKLSVEGCDALNHDEGLVCKCQQALDDMLNAVTCGRWMRIGLRDDIGELPLADIKYEQFNMSKVYALFASHWVATTTDPEMKQFCGRLRKLLLPLVKESMKNDFADGTMEASYKKSLFLTRTGAMGVCPPQAREGDAVVVLFGCRMPVILTRRIDRVSNQDSTDWSTSTPDSPWEFIGECYVNGLMDGETMKNKRESGVPVQTFVLR